MNIFTFFKLITFQTTVLSAVIFGHQVIEISLGHLLLIIVFAMMVGLLGFSVLVARFVAHQEPAVANR